MFQITVKNISAVDFLKIYVNKNDRQAISFHMKTI